MKKPRGSALIMAIWILTVLFLGTVSLAAYVSVHLGGMSRGRLTAESHAAFVAVADWVCDAYEGDLTPGVTSKSDAWIGDVGVPEAWKDRLDVRVSDEASKLDWNTVSPEALEYLFERVGVTYAASGVSRTGLIERLMERRSSRGIEYAEELLGEKELSPEDLIRLRPFLTTFSGKGLGFGVNLNMAEPLVIETLILTTETGSAALRGRLNHAIQKIKLENGIFEEKDLQNPEALIKKLNLDNDPEMHAFVGEFLPQFSAKSGMVSIEAVYRSKRELFAVIDPAVKAGRIPKVIYWHEFKAAYHG